MMSLLLAMLLASPDPGGSAGPTPAPVKGLVKPLSRGAGAKELVAFSMKEMGQAVVVVEGEMPTLMPTTTLPGLKLFDGKLKLFRPVMPLPSDLPVAPWMDLTTTGAPGNPASKSFPIGWGY